MSFDVLDGTSVTDDETLTSVLDVGGLSWPQETTTIADAATARTTAGGPPVVTFRAGALTDTIATLQTALFVES